MPDQTTTTTTITDSAKPNQTPPNPLSQSLRTQILQQPTRPILHHLNADSTWLIQIPRRSPAPTLPNGPGTRPRKPRRYYNILLDPWLTGPQIDIASWFSKQHHARPSAYASIPAVCDLVRAVEHAANPEEPSTRQQAERGEKDGEEDERGGIDLTLLTHEFSDHTHLPTLLTLPPSTPILAPKKSLPIIRALRHFRSVSQIPDFSTRHWRDRVADAAALPRWLRVGRVVDAKERGWASVAEFHAGVVVCFRAASSSDVVACADGGDGDGDEDAVWECVVNTPHGVLPATLRPLFTARARGKCPSDVRGSPALRPLALLHGLHTVTLTRFQTVNLGATNAMRLQEEYGFRYWVGTHDEDKEGGGVVGYVLGRKCWDVGEALRESRGISEGKEAGGGGVEGARYLEVGNGEVVMLV